MLHKYLISSMFLMSNVHLLQRDLIWRMMNNKILISWWWWWVYWTIKRWRIYWLINHMGRMWRWVWLWWKVYVGVGILKRIRNWFIIVWITFIIALLIAFSIFTKDYNDNNNDNYHNSYYDANKSCNCQTTAGLFACFLRLFKNSGTWLKACIMVLICCLAGGI